MVGYDNKTALLVVDVQNDFAGPKGSLYVRGGEQIVPVINGEIEQARRAGAPLVFTQDWHPASTPHFDTDGGPWPVHCVRYTWGAEFHPALRFMGARVRKGTRGEDGYSGFTVAQPTTAEAAAAELEELLRSRGVTRVVVVGIATDYCVRATALDALARGFDTTVLKSAVRAVDATPGDGGRALDEIRSAGGQVA